MSRFPPSVVPILLLAVGLAGCLGGSPETCAHQRGGEEAPPMTLLKDPGGPDGEPGWRMLVQCNEGQAALAAYTFELETSSGRNITVEPVGTWNSPAVYYAATNGTEPGAVIRATTENPGNEGDPSYRFDFIDDDRNGIVDADDRIHILYDAGTVAVDAYDSPFEGGRYEFSVYQRDGRGLVAQHNEIVPDPRID